MLLLGAAVAYQHGYVDDVFLLELSAHVRAIIDPIGAAAERQFRRIDRYVQARTGWRYGRLSQYADVLIEEDGDGDGAIARAQCSDRGDGVEDATAEVQLPSDQEEASEADEGVGPGPLVEMRELRTSADPGPS